MSSIILAFIAYVVGVLCGMGYMYHRYSKRIKRHSREVEELVRVSDYMRGRLDALYVMCGLDPNADAGNETNN